MLIEGGGYGYPSIYSPVMCWVIKMIYRGYSIQDIISQLENILKYVDDKLDKDECIKHIQNCWQNTYPVYSSVKNTDSWCDGWTQDKWDSYHRHMKLQSLGV